MSSLVERSNHNPIEDDITATLFLLLLFNSGGFGVLTEQVYFYSVAFQRERWSLKTLVYTVYLFELSQTVLITKTMFRAFVNGFLDENNLDKIHDLWFSVPIIGGLVACIIQLFYAYRIVRLAKFINSLTVIAIVMVIVILSLGQLVGGIMLGFEMAHLALFSEIIKNQTRISSMLWLGGEVLCDICIAICMIHLLRRTKVEGTSSTRTNAQRVIRLTIETGAMTATIALLNIFLILTHGSRLYYQPSAAAVSKLYSNTLLVSLNSRAHLSAADTSSDYYSTHMSFSSALSEEGPRTTGSLARERSHPWNEGI